MLDKNSMLIANIQVLQKAQERTAIYLVPYQSVPIKNANIKMMERYYESLSIIALT